MREFLFLGELTLKMKMEFTLIHTVNKKYNSILMINNTDAGFHDNDKES